MAIQWLTTMPNPRVRGYGADDGQRGWRTHAVEAEDAEKAGDIRQRPALCGLVPAHGWGIDLFIEYRCKRCARAVAARGV